MDIGIGLGFAPGRRRRGERTELEQLVAEAQALERDGFATASLANIFGVDAMTALGVIGTHTTRIRLRSAVVPTFSRHPYYMAQQAMTTQAACGGRFDLGIGLSHQVVVENMLGLSWAKPFSHMKEYLAVLAPLIRQGRAAFQGAEYRVTAQLNMPGVEPCRILLAALAPKMLALAGAEADGTITWMTGPNTIREHVAPRIREAAEAAGRPAPTIAVHLPIAVTDDTNKAREVAGKLFAMYGNLPSYRAMLDREGAEGPAAVAIVGDEAAVNDQLDALAEAGATELGAAVFPVGDDAEASVARTTALLKSRLS